MCGVWCAVHGVCGVRHASRVRSADGGRWAVGGVRGAKSEVCGVQRVSSGGGCSVGCMVSSVGGMVWVWRVV